MKERLFLHLEDNRIAQKLLARTLEPFGQCLGVRTLQEADAFLAEHADLTAVFVDYSLGEGCGLTFVSKIRAKSQYNHLPIIMLTSTLTNSIAYKAMRSGVNVSMSKLVSPTQIRRTLARLIKRPYVELIQRECYEVWCAVWEKNHQYYQYCPEIEALIVSPTPEEAEKKMRERLETLIFDGHGLPDSIMNLEGYAHRIALKS